MCYFSLGVTISFKSNMIVAFVPSLCYCTPEQSPEVNLHSMREPLTAGTIRLQNSSIKAFLFRVYQRFCCSLSPLFKSHLPCSISNYVLSRIILHHPLLFLFKVFLWFYFNKTYIPQSEKW